MKYLILGKNGQLGAEFCKKLAGQDFSATSHKQLDITNFSAIENFITKNTPKIIINCTAYNQVDLAEKDSTEAFAVNHFAVENLAKICHKEKIKLVHYSTDYVFDGEKTDGFYTIKDKENPLNEYGKSKLAGEKAIKNNLENYLIFRTSWVYGEGTQNFPFKLLQWAKNQDFLKIASDEFSCPTPTNFIAKETLEYLAKEEKGLFHLTTGIVKSRYEWAKEILAENNIDKFIYPCSRNDFSLPAKRGKFLAIK